MVYALQITLAFLTIPCVGACLTGSACLPNLRAYAQLTNPQAARIATCSPSPCRTDKFVRITSFSSSMKISPTYTWFVGTYTMHSRVSSEPFPTWKAQGRQSKFAAQGVLLPSEI